MTKATEAPKQSAAPAAKDDDVDLIISGADVDDIAEDDADEIEQALEAEQPKKEPKKNNSRKASSSKPKADKPEAKPEQPARSFFDIAAIDQKTFDANLNKAAKKVGEKIVNMRQAIEQGKKLSRYTKDAVQMLDKKGAVSSKELVDHYTGAGLSDGTARSQAQQLTAVFKMTGVCRPDDKDTKRLVVADQKLAKELATLSA